MIALQGLRRFVLDDAEAGGVPPRTAWFAVWLPLVLAAPVAASLLYEPAFRFITAEDSLLEWAQFLCFVTAAVLAALAARALWRRSPVAAVLLAVFAVGTLFSAGEEISWGQRVFGWGTPERLAEINHQNETTLHNVTTVPVQKAFNYLQLVAGFYGGVVALLIRARWRRRPLLLDVLVPPVFLAPAFLAMLGYRVLRLSVLSETRFVYVKLGELPELCLAFAFAGVAYSALRRARRLPVAPPSSGAAPTPVPAQDHAQTRSNGTPRGAAARMRRLVVPARDDL